ncbi:uracil-DNA glycosylase [Paludicola sp. MB14-C6]|uniref:uracil-DNA glycosylase n=1 Tax=Paludihabitans sp. MB14-C6 TaxID=3070656 RepID=UPI0027DC1EFA|nr:uracil-DNA glycosylase [Paludicola sp. MB14-C6]WMJ22557.1 uracil-DNA glycosylase [Paludicola sp. MB14-C6]
MWELPNEWNNLLHEEMHKPYMQNLYDFIENEYHTQTIYPKKEDLFTALRLTPFTKVKVVIIGQDPYHQPNQAHGLSFSVKEGNKIPPSLRNIYKEIENSIGIKSSASGDLSRWAKQGVLLLNAILTVRDSSPLSHKGKGWELFTDQIISFLNQSDKSIVFLLWGNDAKKKVELITNPNHLILTSVHPSPLSASRGFFGCNHFQLANEALIQNGLEPIDWS